MSGNEQEALTSGSDSPTKQKPQLSRKQRFSRFCYNKENKKICGRTWQSWICLWIYYIGAYCLFGALFAILIIGDYKARDKNDPQLTILNFQPFLQEPGLTIIPRGDKKQFAEINVLDSDEHIKEINKFLSGYTKTEATILNCHKHGEPKHCKMALDNQTLGPCSPEVDQSFGYSSKEPCIILKVNKIWGWEPKLYGDRPQSMSPDAKFTNSSMPITCERFTTFEDVTHKGNFGEVSVYPAAGFSENCYPYCGKFRDYIQPFVMVKFKGLDTSDKIGVVCVLHAENIKDGRHDHAKLLDRIGIIGFVLNAKP